MTIEEMLTEDDDVFIRCTFEGTNESPSAGFEPTGNRIGVSNMILIRLENGKIVEWREESDRLEFLQQLGIFLP